MHLILISFVWFWISLQKVCHLWSLDGSNSEKLSSVFFFFLSSGLDIWVFQLHNAIWSHGPEGCICIVPLVWWHLFSCWGVFPPHTFKIFQSFVYGLERHCMISSFHVFFFVFSKYWSYFLICCAPPLDRDKLDFGSPKSCLITMVSIFIFIHRGFYFFHLFYKKVCQDVQISSNPS